jgi:amino acid transporter
VRREDKWLRALCLSALIIMLILGRYTEMARLNELQWLLVGSSAAVLILICLTVLNRIRIRKVIESGGSIDVKIRPLKATWYAVIVTMAFLGVFTLASLLQGRSALPDDALIFGMLPIAAVWMTALDASYMNPRY